MHNKLQINLQNKYGVSNEIGGMIFQYKLNKEYNSRVYHNFVKLRLTVSQYSYDMYPLSIL